MYNIKRTVNGFPCYTVNYVKHFIDYKNLLATYVSSLASDKK